MLMKTAKVILTGRWVEKFIEESLLTSYDYILQKDLKILPTNLFDDDNRPAVGILSIGLKTLAAVCSLDEPDGDRELIGIDEVKTIYKTLKKKFSPEYTYYLYQSRRRDGAG